MKRFIIERSDGSVAVMHIVDPKATPEACIAKWSDAEKTRVVGVQPAGYIPEDRTFRNAWKLDGSKVDVDMTKARDVWRDKMRVARAPLLAAADIEISRAVKDPARIDLIEAKRQVLRDVTADPAIETAATPDDLKTVWPAALGEP